MAGKIVADTLENSTAGSIATNYVVEGSAKAWHQFNGTGTVTTLDSFNISSLTDNAAGNYTSLFVNSMSNQYYSPSGSCVGSSVSNFWSYFTSNGSNADIATSSIRFQLVHYTASSNDQNRVNVSIHGDLA